MGSSCLCRSQLKQEMRLSCFATTEWNAFPVKGMCFRLSELANPASGSGSRLALRPIYDETPMDANTGNAGWGGGGGHRMSHGGGCC